MIHFQMGSEKIPCLAEMVRISSLAEQEMAARFYAHAVIGLAMDWIRGDTQAEPEEIVTMLQKLINRR